MLLFELIDANALLSVGFGFCGAVGVDGAFGEEVGATACDDEGAPAVAVELLVLTMLSSAVWLRAANRISAQCS